MYIMKVVQYPRAAGTYKDMRTGPHHVLKIGKAILKICFVMTHICTNIRIGSMSSFPILRIWKLILVVVLEN